MEGNCNTGGPAELCKKQALLSTPCLTHTEQSPNCQGCKFAIYTLGDPHLYPQHLGGLVYRVTSRKLKATQRDCLKKKDSKNNNKNRRPNMLTGAQFY